ncbi:hypothetical protein [Amphritea balenae]|uniref:Outer membrane protein beta-barrel domain-containing protein n=1 Tax=Amphritea balenae TaxID=452629 RepID=A0A3P1ST08_9GAMM|nr:hypothetical protein [Amphritea balenae]RRD00025.1 hypothetical protein EHS89_07365 [Amphritea balenae]GGK75958.1 hypothetical protein GCM10007941_27650 [Amphritea balenae]
MSLKQVSLVAYLAAFLSVPIAHAEVGFGAGVSYVFGEGVAVGLRVFSDNEEGKGVGLIGLDYMPGTGGVRPSVGIAYLGENVYGELNTGYNNQKGEWNLGIGAGLTDTDEDPKAAPAVAVDTGDDMSPGPVTDL